MAKKKTKSKSKIKMKLNYDAPVTIIFTLLSVLLFVLDWFLLKNKLNSTILITPTCDGEFQFSFKSFFSYLRLFLYVFGSGEALSFFAKLVIISLLGSAMEERYGSMVIGIMIFVATIFTGVLSACCCKLPFSGSDAVVFMLILLDMSGDKLLKKDMEEEDIESLLVQQIEFCSTLVINKKDLVSEEDFKKVRAVINAIHPGVKIFETSHGDVPVQDILNTNTFDFETVYSSAGWCKKLEEDEADDHDDDDHEEHEHHHHDDDDEHEEHEHHHHHDHDDDDDEHEGHGHHHHHHEHKHEGESEDEYGIGTFIYYRRKPFDRQLLDEYANKWPRNIIRCKGLMWFADEPEMAWVFETAGRQIQAGYSGQWIATAPEKEREQILKENPKIKADWDDEVGDRMIKLCIIGQKLDKEKISAELDACLAK